jgi:hypothetical protein
MTCASFFTVLTFGIELKSALLGILIYVLANLIWRVVR